MTLVIKIEAISHSLEAVRAAHELGCSKYIGVGTQAEYGPSKADKLAPDTPCCPTKADGILKYAAGKISRLQAEHYGMSFIWMRVFSVYGRYDRDNSMVSATIRKLRRGEHCSFTPCEQMWEYLNAEDIGRAFCLVGERVTGSRVYCVGSGDARPLREFIEIIRDVVAPGTELGIGELPYPPDPVMRLCADISDLQRDTGWAPKISFEEGIRRLSE